MYKTTMLITTPVQLNSTQKRVKIAVQHLITAIKALEVRGLDNAYTHECLELYDLIEALEDDCYMPKSERYSIDL